MIGAPVVMYKILQQYAQHVHFAAGRCINPENPTLGLNAGGRRKLLNRNGKQVKTVYLGFFRLFPLLLLYIQYIYSILYTVPIIPTPILI